MSADTRVDLLFATGRFNLSEPREYFINECCYGDDAARWLVERLRWCGLSVTEPDQEDWGWYFEVKLDDQAYFVGVGGNADEASSQDVGTSGERASNQGQWRLIVERHRTLWQKLSGGNRLSPDDGLLRILEEIVKAEPGFTWMGRE